MPKIYMQKHGNMTIGDWSDLALLLIKAGYTVRKGREKKNPKSNAYAHFVEYTAEERFGIYDESK